MKIKHRNLNEAWLKEADELGDLNPQEASIDELADALADAVEDETANKSTLSDEKADKLAKEVKQTADEVGADQAGVLPSDETEDEYVTENKITHILDKALKSSLRAYKSGKRNNSNVLIVGLAGSGKTAISTVWAESRGLHLVPLNAADSKIDSAINGMPIRNMEDNDKAANSLVYAYAMEQLKDLMDPKYEGKCILFVDEFNRQQDGQLRRTFLSLFNEKRNATGSLDFRKNLLFTIVCINPNCREDLGAVKLNGPEISRFMHQIPDADSDADSANNYALVKFANRMKKAGKQIPAALLAGLHKRSDLKKLFDNIEADDADIELKILDLGKKIYEDPQFKFDQRVDMPEIFRDQKQQLNQRILDDAIEAAGGDVDEFLDWVDNSSNLLDKNKRMFHNILDSYQVDLPQLRKDYLGDDQAATVSGSALIDDDQEDDAGLFNVDNNLSRKATASSNLNSLQDIISGWDKI